jgi:hypothetical protein
MKKTARIMGFVVLLCLPRTIWATPVIVVGEHELLADTADQLIEIMVSGGDSVQGLNLRLQVADGGTHPDAGGSIDGPKISNIDLVSGTIFDGNNTGQNGLLSLPQVWVQSITTANGMVAADGMLATVMIDTTGFMDGEFDLRVGETLDGATDFAGVPVDITDGSIRIVPEPASFLGMLAGIGMICAALRRVSTKSR